MKVRTDLSHPPDRQTPDTIFSKSPENPNKKRQGQDTDSVVRRRLTRTATTISNASRPHQMQEKTQFKTKT